MLDPTTVSFVVCVLLQIAVKLPCMPQCFRVIASTIIFHQTQHHKRLAIENLPIVEYFPTQACCPEVATVVFVEKVLDQKVIPVLRRSEVVASRGTVAFAVHM